MKRKTFLRFGICILALMNTSFISLPIDGTEATSMKPKTIGIHSTDFDTIRTDLNQYLWPTDASTKITSSFAEYRSTHFHGGIDISTNGQTGYKVFAVRDGFIYRIRITPNGYGKMLFVKHSDGYVSTYAHLKTFNEEINKVAREEQYRKETFAIDLILDSSKLPIKRGEVIAYTGNTGFGPPHLHFELRDENLDPVNPLLSQNYIVKDDIPPFIRRVMIAPLSYNSTVEYNSAPRYYSRFPRNKHKLIIPQPIRVHGQIGFGVDAVDRSDGTWSKAGIHRMELYLDDSLTFSIELNRVPAEETKQIDLHYDYPSILNGRGWFQKLYIDKGNVLPFYNHRPEGSGIINTENFSEGKHEYRIVCMDIRGNYTELNGTLIANHRPTIQIERIDNDEIVLNGNNLESIAKCIVYGKRAFQPNWSQHTLDRSRFEFDGTDLVLTVNTKPYDVIKVIAESKSGSESSPIFHFIKKQFGPARTIHIETEIVNDFVRFTITTPGVFTQTPELSVQEGIITRDMKLEAVDVNKYTGIFVPSDSIAGQRTVKVTGEVNGKLTSSEDSFTVYPIPTNRAGTVSFDQNHLIIAYDSGAVYKMMNLQIESEIHSHSTVYIIEPQDVLLNRGIKVTLPFDRSQTKNHLGLYYRSRTGWIFQTAQADSSSSTFSTTLTRTLGEVALFRDDIQPTFGKLRIQLRSGYVYISFRYHDNLSGVDTDEIKMYLDNKLVIPEIEGEHNRVWYQNEERLDRGRHFLKITMKDRAKNETEITRTFSVK